MPVELRGMTRGIRAPLALLCAGRVVQALLGVAFALCTRTLVDCASRGGEGFGPVAVLAGGLLLMQVALRYLVQLGASRLERRWTMKTRQRMFSHLLRADFGQVSQHPGGELVARLHADVGGVCGNLLDLWQGGAVTAASFVGAMAALWVLSPWIACALAALGCAFVLLGAWLGRGVQGRQQALSRAEAALRADEQELLASRRSLLSRKARENAEERERNSEQGALAAWGRLFRTRQGLRTGTDLFFRAGGLLALVLGIWSVQSGTMTYGGLLAALQLAALVQQPFNDAPGLLGSRWAMQAAKARLHELADIPAEAPPRDLPGTLLALGAEGVCFSYDQDAVLTDVSFRVEAGGMWAVTGRSGIGKTTLLDLLLGLRAPCGGALYAETDAGRFPLDASTRELMAFVPQRCKLPGGTLRAALTFLSGVAEEEKQRAALAVCALDLAQELPQGLDTPLGEYGQGLSEGQRQRVALAAAILQNKPVLLLDEATSALDAATEARVMAGLRALRGVTVLAVTHHAAAARACDGSLALSGGRMIQMRREEQGA